MLACPPSDASVLVILTVEEEGAGLGGWGVGGWGVTCFINTQWEARCVPGQCYSLFSVRAGGLWRTSVGGWWMFIVTQSPAASVQSLDLVYSSHPHFLYFLILFVSFPALCRLPIISSHLSFPLSSVPARSPGNHIHIQINYNTNRIYSKCNVEQEILSINVQRKQKT